MARRATMKDGEEGAGEQKIAGTPEDLRRVIDELHEAKTEASKITGEVGKATKQACDTYGWDNTALTFTRRLRGMEEGKRMGVIRALLNNLIDMTWLDEIDAFDDLATKLNDLVNKGASPSRQQADGLNKALTH